MTDHDEWRSAVADLNEVQRINACTHTARQGSQSCPDCGTEAEK